MNKNQCFYQLDQFRVQFLVEDLNKYCIKTIKTDVLAKAALITSLTDLDISAQNHAKTD